MEKWINEYRKNLNYNVSVTSLSNMKKWSFIDGVLRRDDNSFFSVKAIQTDYPVENLHETVIIHQPEPGILGFIVRGIGDDMEILLHAKSEPGNVNVVQIGPSVQATKANYLQKHHGKKSTFIDLFLDPNANIIVEKLQSEQGNRFNNKYNNNMVVRLDKDIELPENKFKWFGIGDIKNGINTDYLFNTDFKSVISHLLEEIILKSTPSTSVIGKAIYASYHNHIQERSFEEVLDRVENRRKEVAFTTSFKEIEAINEQGIPISDKVGFGVGFFNVYMVDREVIEWDQPLVIKDSIELLTLKCFRKQGELHFIFRERQEIGFANYFQLGPTIQFDTMNVNDANLESGTIIAQFYQSEEGGRFYKNVSCYQIMEVDDPQMYVSDDQYYILNVYEICQLLKTSGIFTNESRSMIAGVLKFV